MRRTLLLLVVAVVQQHLVVAVVQPLSSVSCSSTVSPRVTTTRMCSEESALRGAVGRVVPSSRTPLLPADADLATVKTAYRRLAAVLHPDVSSATDAPQVFAQLSTEYQALVRQKKAELQRQEIGFVLCVVAVVAAVSDALNQDALLPAVLALCVGGVGVVVFEQEQARAEEAEPLGPDALAPAPDDASPAERPAARRGRAASFY